MGKKKKLIRSESSKKLAGVCGAFAEYFGVKVKIVRLIYIALTVLTFFFPGIFLYLFLMLIFPQETNGLTSDHVDESTNKQE